MNKILNLLQYVILMTSTLIPKFRTLSANWTVANINFASQYKSYAGSLIFLLLLFLHLTCLIWHFCKRSPQVVTDLILLLKSFQTNGSPYHISVEKAILIVGRICPARRALLACWSFPYVCGAGGWSALLWEQVCICSTERRAAGELLPILWWLGTLEIANSFCQQWMQTYLWH